MGYKCASEIMKRFLMFFVAVVTMLLAFSNNADAQERKKIGDGIYIVSYGNVTVIENDNVGMTTEVKVVKKGTDSRGQAIYDILCKNKVTKGITQGGLTAAITAALKAAGIPIPSWAVGPIVREIYEGVCAYYE